MQAVVDVPLSLYWTVFWLIFFFRSPCPKRRSLRLYRQELTTTIPLRDHEDDFLCFVPTDWFWMLQCVGRSVCPESPTGCANHNNNNSIGGATKEYHRCRSSVSPRRACFPDYPNSGARCSSHFVQRCSSHNRGNEESDELVPKH